MSGQSRSLVVTGNVIQLQACSLYAHHCAIVEEHHVCPDSWWVAAGKDPKLSPMRVLCPNCHLNVHAAIDSTIKKQDTSLLPPRCRALAAEAFTIAQQQGLTPALTL